MTGAANSKFLMDGMQYAAWSEEIFQEMRSGGLSAVHVTIAYHENFRDTVDSIIAWNDRFRRFGHLISFADSVEAIEAAGRDNKTAILFGTQNPSPMEADLGLLEILHRLGVRFMQLSYNNQSPLCTGWTEQVDSGLTHIGREAVREMNRLGMVIDMSHSGERSTLDAIAVSERPITVSHANPKTWRATGRNKSPEVLKALARRKGLLGLSLYPEHLPSGSATTLDEFARMAADVADLIGADRIGIGSDLCQGQGAGVLAWMREGKWRRSTVREDERPTFPQQPSWFRSNLDFPGLRDGLAKVGFASAQIDGILGENWRTFLRDAFRPGTVSAVAADSNPFATRTAA